MKKNMRLVALAAVCSAAVCSLALTACSMDLDPASNGAPRAASLELKIAALVPPAGSFAGGSPSVSGSRIVAPDYGYLYFRTIGGPVGSSGPLYGPFRINTGETFKTTAIPAGTYDGIGVLYATKPLEDLMIEVKGVTYTFTEMMRLPDEEFTAITDGNDSVEGPSPFDYLLDGWASGELVDNVTIVEGKANTLSVTLVPITGSGALNFAEGVDSISCEGDSAVLERRFLALEGVNPTTGYTINSLSVIITPGSGETYIGRCMLYGGNGSLVRDFGIVGTVAEPRTLTATQSVSATAEGSDFYLYIEYRTALLNLAFDAAETLVEQPPVPPVPQTLTISVTGDGTCSECQVFYQVYRSDAFIDINGNSTTGPDEAPVAAGVFNLDTAGTGSALAASVSTGETMVFSDGYYYVTAFIDRDGTYSEITDFITMPGGMEAVIPNYQDWVTLVEYGGVTISGAPMTYSLAPVDFVSKNEYVYFVNQDGNGGGNLYGAPCSLSSLVSLFFTTTNTTPYEIYLVGDVTVSSMITFNCSEVTLGSFGATTHTIRNECASGTLFTINSTSDLTLHHVSIDSEAVTEGYGSTITVLGRLTVADGTIIQNSAAVEGSSGAILFANGSSGTMTGGLIQNCTGPNGAIMVQAISSNTTFTMSGGTINGCTDSYGGVYLEGVTGSGFNGAFIMNGGTISDCHSTSGEGGGVHIAAGGNFIFSDGFITDCTTSGNGAGVYVGSYGTMTLSGGTIDTCTAAAGLGGGIYVYPLGTLNLVDGLVTRCSATQGSGLFVAYNGIVEYSLETINTIIQENVEDQYIIE